MKQHTKTKELYYKLLDLFEINLRIDVNQS